VLAVALVATGCSSSSHSQVQATTSTTAAVHTRAFCAAWNQLATLGQDTAVADVARNIVALRTVARQLATEAPSSISPEARRYAAVIAAVAQSLSSGGQQTPNVGTEGQLTAADRAALARFVADHCAKG
jgi:hypothetical protein